MQHTNEFVQMLNFSTKASRFVMEYLKEIEHRTIVDASDDAEAQKKGYDFTVDGETAEFKIDTRMAKTGNIAYELVGNDKTGRPGACVSSEATWLYYFDKVNQICHIIHLPTLKLRIRESKNTLWKVAKAFNWDNRGNVTYCSFSLLLPLEWVQKLEGVQYRQINLAEYLAPVKKVA